MKPRLLIVDDDDSICTQLKWGLTERHEVLVANEPASALRQFAESQPPVVLLDLGLPPNPATATEGLKLLAGFLEADPFCKVIIATGQSERESALKAIGGGAYDYLTKPINLDDLERIVTRALHVSQLEREHALLPAGSTGVSFEGLVGDSAAMETVFASIRKVAPTEAPVLILGESGTGKELTAHAIHRRSSRCRGPFVVINCGAIPENLLETELFGHEKGAFTGAINRRLGRVEAAAGGTVFLDEVGELPLSLQVKLLRFLQEHVINRVGSNEEIPVDVRVVAASNSELNQKVTAGTFREDLYYRLAVVVLQVPALRQRGGDLQLLAQTFLQRFRSENGRKNLRFAPAALEAIERYDWPGNVRELENRVRRGIIMAEGRQISAGDLELDGVYSSPMSLREARDQTDRMLVEQALRRNGGKITHAARDLGVSRPTLYELMDRLHLRSDNPERGA